MNIGTNVRPGIIWKRIHVAGQVFFQANKNKQNQLQVIWCHGYKNLQLHMNGNLNITK